MTRAFPTRAIHPLGLETECIKLGLENRAHLAHAVEVLRPAVDVDDALKQGQGLVIVRVNERDQSAIVRRQRGLCSDGRGRNGQQEHDADYEVPLTDEHSTHRSCSDWPY